MSGTVHKELRPLLKEVEALGCRIEQTKKNHLVILVPGGGRVVVSGTPSCPRAVQNTRRDLRRQGLAI